MCHRRTHRSEPGWVVYTCTPNPPQSLLSTVNGAIGHVDHAKETEGDLQRAENVRLVAGAADEIGAEVAQKEAFKIERLEPAGREGEANERHLSGSRSKQWESMLWREIL